MKSRPRRGKMVLLAFVGVALVVLLFGMISRTPGGSDQSGPLSQAPTGLTSKVIMAENAHAGTSSWQIPYDRQASTQIQAYASALSVLPGQTLTFYVSTQIDGTSYAAAIYRLGWYGGTGGRLLATLTKYIGHAQGYYDKVYHRLVDCKTCYVDAKTGLIEAKWQASYMLTIPSDWITGVYLAKLTDANGMQTYVPFDVRGNAHTAYIAVTSDTTYAAYNDWGGYSLYAAENSLGPKSLGRGVKVSFDRPYTEGYGSGYVLQFEADAIHWLERQGYDLSYMSSVDLHENPAQLLQHRAYLSLGHDEYWTKEMRDGVEYARDNGVGLAFLGADTSSWQIRLEPDSAGVSNRTIVCYKVETGNQDLARDPLYGKDNTRVTAEWRDPVLARPGNALIGIMFSGYTTGGHSFPWRVSSSARSPLLNGTGLLPGQSYGCDLVGYEWDRAYDNGATPAGLVILSISPTVGIGNQPDISNTTYYIAPSGAMVFATGSIYWTFSLDSYRFITDKACAGQNPVVPGMQKLMARVMDALVIVHSLDD